MTPPQVTLPPQEGPDSRAYWTARSCTLALVPSRVDRDVRVKPQVLFVCVHNAGRSQIAAGLLEHHAMGRIDVLSAGSAPTDSINAMAKAVLQEWGIDISTRQPSVLLQETLKESDVVVTMGCGDACPVLPGKRYLDWDLVDPAGQDLDTVRHVRDEIDKLVRRLLAELLD